MEATKKAVIIECLGALAHELMEISPSFEYNVQSLKFLGRKQCTKFEIMVDQEWKKKYDVLSSDEIMSNVTTIKKEQLYRNVILVKMLEEAMLDVSESDLSENDDSVASSLAPLKLKYSIFDNSDKYLVEVNMPGVPADKILVEFSSGKLTVQTTQVKTPHDGMRPVQEGFRYGGYTRTEIQLPHGTKLVKEAPLDKGILFLSVLKRKKQKQTALVFIPKENTDN
ncbi:hypothetical protein C9374_010283 [Naegleria lovaniensis]|uniref:SHSP domain-containing protein n=1 Tax=Naegleria lovaniensis TaxID=51637 RepID=A0AA88GHZ6_NAELO|nr:uncharacterized protein C9374_010283 [Naegleria lovaniensis]KAG2374909.1 hypothetical protein C9374_010283 [Naegleria lovaniensis]